jgi:cytochrome c5
MTRAPRIALALALLAAAAPAGAQDSRSSGREVYDVVCASCHDGADKSAPRIGDRSAWATLRKKGQEALTRDAIHGIRDMPAHGGSKGLSDYEIQRATVYLVNSSGGNWIEPRPPGAPAVKRSGEQVVKEQCSQCHLNGYADAPRIGDHANWQYYLRLGMDAAVRKVVRGHGDMPPRGGEADLTDEEIRAATIVMARKPPRKPR